jgi:serine/threonine-protein kinase
MSDDQRVQQLLDQLLDSDATPEAVCGSCPELLPVVRDRWRQVRRLRAELDALFPSSEGPTTQPAEGPALPQVPGYEVEGVLGRGGMGIVFRAKHLRLNRLVALKMALAGAYAEPREKARFQREAEAVAGLRHPNVVQIYDIGDADGRPYFTMELVEGGSLAQKLAGTPQQARPAAALVVTLAGAMQAAHQGGIVHRDLKPSNVLLTADGTPKITDFGLARRLEGGTGLSQSGLAMGTPSYMAPEQARGQTHAIGPTVDVYALGAILYELLTGRPPFRGETVAETVQQVIDQEPVPPTRLNAKVPRDLETICLKCLQKEPARRYASAAELADDLGRFREGQPIRARPLGVGARLVRWARRKPAAAALVAMALALVGLAIGGGLWLERQAAERREETARQEGRESAAVEALLKQAADLQKRGHWPESRAVLGGAPGLLGPSAPAGLRQRVRQALADANMVAQLEEIGLRLAEARNNHETVTPGGNQRYAEAFRNYGIALTVLEPAAAAARIRTSAIRETLLAFLHDWMLNWETDADRDRLRAVLDRADDDAWRRRLRQALSRVYNPGKREELLRAREALAQPPVVLAGLAGVLLRGPLEEKARALLREAQRRHPEDFWLNLQLGCYLQEERPQEAVACFRAAVAIRPSSDQAYTMLGRALRNLGDADGASAAFRKAMELNPTRVGGRDLARVLAARGGLEEARAVWEKYLARDPPTYDPWYGYAQLCAFLGNEVAYAQARKTLLERFGDTTNDWVLAERTSLACLLLPASGAELRRAVVLVDRAVAAGPKFPQPDHAYLQFVKGLAEYRQGRSRQAVPLLRESAALLPNRAGPRLALALAQFQSGSRKEARKTLAAAVRAYNWQAPQANHTTAWVSHVLRREAEALILPNLPAFLRGQYQPQDNDERLALLGACQFRGLYAAAARLYADAFAADSNLADNLTTECRYRTLREEHPDDDRMEPLNTECRYLAARCAALAGCGLGKDGARLSTEEQARWRRQARAWLQADLAVWARSLDSGFQADRDLARKMLTHWQVEPDLAGLREPQALDELSADERKDCLALWHEVRLVLKRTAPPGQTTAPLDPKILILIGQGKLEEARVAWRTTLEANPVEHDAWNGYAEFCLFLGREDDYRRARTALLARFGATVNAFHAERTARACLLRPAPGDVLRQAAALARRAAAENQAEAAWAFPFFKFALGLAEYRQGRFDRAIAVMRGDASRVLGPAPRLVLAMALHRSGQVARARKTLAAAVLAHDWRANQVYEQNGWIIHLLRREAESMILPKLPAFLDGKYRPEDNDERLALRGVCQFTNRTHATARLYADAFAAAPALADDLAAGHRNNAARAAALAGCGLGADASKLTDPEKTALRKHARAWLKADLDARLKRLKGRKTGDPVLAVQALCEWQVSDDLAAVHDELALAKLPEAERKEWRALWADFKVLISQDPATALALARAYVDRKQWARAANQYAQLLNNKPPLDGEVWFEYAAVQLLSGDRAGYRQSCKVMLNAGRDKKLRPFLVARACTLAPLPGIDLVLASAVSAAELKASESESWSPTVQGALCCRTKRFKEALPLFERSLRLQNRPGVAVLNWLWLALAHHQLGQTAEAHSRLEMAGAWLDSLGSELPANADSYYLHRHNWLEAQILRREAEALLSPK